MHQTEDNASSGQTAEGAAAARKYLARGWRSIPYPLRTKFSTEKGWSEWRLEGEALDAAFAKPCNLGLLLGEPSGGLADADLDCAEAIIAADYFLSPTGSAFGRPETPTAHREYICTPTDFPTKQFADPTAGPEDEHKGMLIELRGTGSQTMAPPSIHPFGEQLEWAREGEPTKIAHAELLQQVTKIAAVALLARHWPKGNRHTAALAVAGALLRSGWAEGEVDEFVYHVARAARDEEASARRADVKSSAKKHAGGKPTTGQPTCASIFGEVVWAKVREWLELKVEFREPPRPLFREVPPGDPFPVEALGETGGAAALKIHEATGAPIEICAQSTLATMNLAVMGHIDVVMPTGEVKPVSEFFATIGSSGERKTAADRRATEAVTAYENQHDESYRTERKEWEDDVAAWERARLDALSSKQNKSKQEKADALRALGDKPEAPISPMILCGGDPTVEGLIRLFREGGVSIAGVFTDEGGQFIGGHAMNDETRLRTAAALSKMWDGQPARRVRGGDGFYAVKNRRLAAHILIQPEAAQAMFTDRVLCDQGILTRFLASMPERAAGTRRYVKVTDLAVLDAFTRRVRALLDQELPYANPMHKRDGLNPKTINLSPGAEALWARFYGYVEGLIGPGRQLDEVVGLANKAPEHATRLAATVAYFDGGQTTVNIGHMQAGVKLVRYYLGEALRIRMAAAIDADLDLAKKLLAWLYERCGDGAQGLVSLVDIYQLAPNRGLRSKAAATRIVDILQEHGWLERQSPTTVNGVPRRDVWRIVKE